MGLKTVGQRIQHLAEEVGGVAALARYSGLSRTGLQGIITRGIEPSPRTLLLLQHTTGCPWDWLSSGQGPEPKIDLSALRISPALSDEPRPTGLRRKNGNPAKVLGLISERVREAIADSDPAALDAAVPAAILAAYRTGQAIPGPAHLAAIAQASGWSESRLLGEI